MAEKQSNLSGTYRFTSIARPIDPAYLTNRWLLIILPALALVSAGLASYFDLGVSPMSAAFGSTLAAFVAWALTRELAPDDNGAAFVALALAWTINIGLGVRLVLLLFVALLLARVVNRSTGLPLRWLDTLGIFGFSAWAATSTQQPLILLVASLAFALDAALAEPLRRHYPVAAACGVVFLWMLPGGTTVVADDLAVRDWSLIAASALCLLFVVKTNPSPISYCDTSPDRLDRVRVNAGLVVGWLVAVQTVVTNGQAGWLQTPIWVCLIAVVFSSVLRQVKRWPSPVIARQDS